MLSCSGPTPRDRDLLSLWGCGRHPLRRAARVSVTMRAVTVAGDLNAGGTFRKG